MTTTKHTAYLGRTPYGERIFIHISTSAVRLTHRTTEHEEIDSVTRISITGSGVPARGRSVSFCGQIVDDVRNLLRPAATLARGWTRDDIASLLKIWEEWHLNDMQAGCAHMDLPADTSYDTRREITCPMTGYRYGSSWLVKVPTSEILAEVERLRTLGTPMDVPHYVR